MCAAARGLRVAGWLSWEAGSEWRLVFRMCMRVDSGSVPSCVRERTGAGRMVDEGGLMHWGTQLLILGF